MKAKTANMRIGAWGLAAALLHGCAATQPPQQPVNTGAAAALAPAPRELLAPTGRLRIAVYPGSPTSMVRAGNDGDARGLSVEIGRELARRLGVPADLVVLDRAAQVVDALRIGQADVTITNATAARAQLVDFTAPLVGLELGYLVPPGSAVAALDGVDQPGVRVGVSQGSSSQAALGRLFRQAQLVPADSLAVAGEMLRERRIDAFATNKGILFELADKLPGARVLDGRWGVESLALAVPQGRRAAAAFLDSFVEDIRRQGLVKQAAERAGLRGLTEPERR
jgi:polar amino acid transport system substrate-binding protein